MSERNPYLVFDTSAYEPDYEVMDTYEDRAYVLGSFTETLRPRTSGPGVHVHGRAVLFWRRDEGAWRITRLFTCQSAPDEPMQAPSGSRFAPDHPLVRPRPAPEPRTFADRPSLLGLQAEDRGRCDDSSSQGAEWGAIRK